MSTTDETLEFNAALDIDAAARTFAARGRVCIADILETSSAARLHACLVNEVPWRLAYNEGMKNIILDEAALAKLDANARSELMMRALKRAQEHFQYLYHAYPMVTAYLNKENPGLFLHRVLEWLNMPETLELMRRITGVEELYKADARATLYGPGDFLTLHDDSGTEEQHRRVAYVLNLTQGWRADWGGQLQFLTKDGRIEEVWLPGFNTLGLFVVPTPHAVSYVAPFANQGRYAVTGWLCDG